METTDKDAVKYGTAVWWPRGGMPQVPEYRTVEAAMDAANDHLASRGLIGAVDPVMGTRWYWPGDWRDLSEVPEGYVAGWERYEKGIDTGQQVFARPSPHE